MLDKTALIIEKKSYFSRTAGGYWRRKPDSVTVEAVNAEYYNNTIESIPFFKDRVYRSYTCKGYLPTRLTAISWGTRSTKVERMYYIFDERDQARFAAKLEALKEEEK